MTNSQKYSMIGSILTFSGIFLFIGIIIFAHYISAALYGPLQITSLSVLVLAQVYHIQAIYTDTGAKMKVLQIIKILLLMGVVVTWIFPTYAVSMLVLLLISGCFLMVISGLANP